MFGRMDFFPQNDDYLDSIAMTVDFGDISHKSSGQMVVEVDEVFGNEFVKDKIIDPNAVEDPRIGSAQDAITGNASMPVDLNPELTPEFTSEARSAGVEGTVTLEMIVSDDGKVLRARSVGRKLGFGLEESAIKAFKKKRYVPSKAEGKPITVKFYQPVRFSLVR
ncbi:MAG: energy transducer TonB [Leptospira sp.]|nr:energy transducer TonB [Leptospira sp.]